MNWNAYKEKDEFGTFNMIPQVKTVTPQEALTLEQWQEQFSVSKLAPPNTTNEIVIEDAGLVPNYGGESVPLQIKREAILKAQQRYTDSIAAHQSNYRSW